MAESPVRRVTPAERTPAEPTPGIERAAAIVHGDLWSGTAKTGPGVVSGWHHHGEHDSIIYVVEGAFDVETANGLTRAEVGDFVHIPAHTVHREGNSSSEPAEVVLVRRGTGPVVVNVDGPAAG
jgi:uncharacterized RmlC-like cupin family protein